MDVYKYYVDTSSIETYVLVDASKANQFVLKEINHEIQSIKQCGEHKPEYFHITKSNKLKLL